MGQLLVRGLEPEVIEALKKLATKNGRSAEAEHREILKTMLTGPPRISFIEALQQIPEVGNDADFQRQDDAEDDSVFT